MRLRSLLRGLVFDLLLLPVLVLVLPWLLFLIIGRRRGVGAFLERLGGWRIAPKTRERIWLHCVSVGELNLVGPLIDELRAARPGSEVVLSVTTTTARELAAARYPELSTHLYPIDFSFAVRRVLRRVQPDVLVLVELELWPQTILEATAREIPLVVVNGRISDRSFPRLQKLGALVRPLFRRLTAVSARDETTAERFRALGTPADRITTPGDLKLDRPLRTDGAATRATFEKTWGGVGEPRWVAGCTHPGEEDLLFETHRALRSDRPTLLLLIAPRHLERVPQVVARAEALGFRVGRTSAPPPSPPEGVDVVVLDQVGFLAALYAVGDIAFVGGSLIERGGHNLLEPVAAGVATIHGPHVDNFRDLARLLHEHDVTRTVDADTLAAQVRAAWEEPKEGAARVERGRALLEGARGAARETSEGIVALLESRSKARRARQIPPSSPSASVEVGSSTR